MSMVVVADTSPINYLMETGYFAVLPSLYGRAILPTAVHRELMDKGSSDIVRQWARALPAWISVQTPTASPMQPRGKWVKLLVRGGPNESIEVGHAGVAKI